MPLQDHPTSVSFGFNLISYFVAALISITCRVSIFYLRRNFLQRKLWLCDVAVTLNLLTTNHK